MHLDSTLGRASVIKCMFCIEVSGEKNTGVYVWTCPESAPLPGPHLGSAPTCKPPVPQQRPGPPVRHRLYRGCCGAAAQSVTSRRETEAQRQPSKLGCASSPNPGWRAAVDTQPCPWWPHGVLEKPPVDGKSLGRLLAEGTQEDLRSRFPGQRRHYGGLPTPCKETPEGRR